MWVFETPVPNLQFYAHFDDTIGTGDELGALATMMAPLWTETRVLKMVVRRMGIRPLCSEYFLRGVKNFSSTWERVDVVWTSQEPRPTTRRKAQDFITKCTFILLVPFSQRSALLVEAKSGMWLPSGTSVNQWQSCRTYDLGGNKVATEQNRHMLELTRRGAHFTMLAAATVCESIRSSFHMGIIRNWTVDKVQGFQTREFAPHRLARAAFHARPSSSVVMLSAVSL